MKKYQERKQEAQQQAIIWQLELSEKCLSYAELAEATEHFAKLARNCGLIKEFKENGII